MLCPAPPASPLWSCVGTPVGEQGWCPNGTVPSLWVAFPCSRDSDLEGQQEPKGCEVPSAPAKHKKAQKGKGRSSPRQPQHTRYGT